MYDLYLISVCLLHIAKLLYHVGVRGGHVGSRWMDPASHPRVPPETTPPTPHQDLNPKAWTPRHEGLKTWTPTPESTQTWIQSTTLCYRYLRPDPNLNHNLETQDRHQEHQQGPNPNYQDNKPEESSLQDLSSELSIAVATIVHLHATFILHSKLDDIHKGGGFKTVQLVMRMP